MVTAGQEILAVCLEMGGSLTGEHGVGVEKREAMAQLYAPDDLAVMGELRTAFNPDGLCNPKKVLPTGSRCIELAPAGRQAAL